MLDLAKHILETKKAKFDPSKFEDRYETALKELIAAKQAGKKSPTSPSRQPTNVASLMDALRRSVQAERRGSPSGAGRSSAHKRSVGRPATVKRASAKRRRASCEVGLQVSRRKRRCDVALEPRGRAHQAKGNQFVIQKHAARRLHYVLRL